jgi:homoserine dehydrogenase
LKGSIDLNKNLKVSFLGLGVIGTQLMEYIRENQSDILEQYQVQLNIHVVFVRDVSKKRNIDVSNLTLTDNPYEAFEEADIVIECLGGNGVELTKELILSAIRKKKAVIMSSKKCLAWYGSEIMKEVQRNNTLFRYDATVGGSIPISSILMHMGKCEKINKIYGISNATSNFVLGEMKDKEISYNQALQNAKQKGYAENNPDEDVKGYDSLYKSIILMGFEMNKWMDHNQIKPISIKSITKEAMRDADQKDCAIKSVFCIEAVNDEISCYIGPREVKKDTILATVNANNNIIIIEGSESGERAFYGQGAGAKPTASAMFDDLISIISKMS